MSRKGTEILRKETREAGYKPEIFTVSVFDQNITIRRETLGPRGGIHMLSSITISRSEFESIEIALVDFDR